MEYDEEKEKMGKGEEEVEIEEVDEEEKVEEPVEEETERVDAEVVEVVVPTKVVATLMEAAHAVIRPLFCFPIFRSFFSTSFFCKVRSFV